MSAHDPPRPWASFETHAKREIVVSCLGELDPATALELRAALGGAVAQHPAAIVVDLAAVTFFDCSAIGEFVRARTAARLHGTDLVVRSVSPLGQRVLKMLGLDSMSAPVAAPHVRDDGATGRYPHSVGDVVASWSDACKTAPFGAMPLAFDDPNRIVAALVGPSGSGHQVQRAPVAPSVAEAARASNAGVAKAAMQLLALHAVVRQHHPAHVGRAAEHAIATAIAMLLDELEHAALLDPLTGLLNRRALHRDLVAQLATARRHHQCLSIVMIDVDDLKTVNDELGHAAGDAKLRAVARRLTSALRAGDNSYRIGGDEFVLVLPDLCPEDVHDVMGRVVVEERGAFTWGCAWVRGEEDPLGADVVAQLLHLADERMLAHRARTHSSGRSAPDPGTPPQRADQPSPSVAEVAGQLVSGNRDLVVVERARGLIAEHFETDLDDAARKLHAYAREHHQAVATVAAALMDHSLDAAQLGVGQPDVDPPPAGRTTSRAAGAPERGG